MHPIEEFEACVQFLHDLGSIFLDTKEREVKHAMAGLFVEIMLPMAAVSLLCYVHAYTNKFVRIVYSRVSLHTSWLLALSYQQPLLFERRAR